MRWDSLWINTHLATMNVGPLGGIIQHGAIASLGGRIVWIGRQVDLPGEPHILSANVYDGKGRWLTPGLIDSHTHLVYSGHRSVEFALRLQGISYTEIASSGGGILSTVTATRHASPEQLYQESAKRLQASIAAGVTCIEIKSGYGLDLENEAKILKVARQLGIDFGVHVKTSYLGAHVCPPEWKDPDDYIQAVVEEYLPELAARGLVDAVDVFCESMAFTLVQCERVFQKAAELQLPVKCHAEQMSAIGASQMSARYQALSVDHLEYAGEAEVEAIAAAGTTAVLLPGAFYTLREKQVPPIELLRAHQVPIALATDCNPGTSPFSSLPLIMNMACVLWGMSPYEALQGVTIHAARALGDEGMRGVLALGAVADYAQWEIEHLDQICAAMDANFHTGTIVAGDLHDEKNAFGSSRR